MHRLLSILIIAMLAQVSALAQTRSEQELKEIARQQLQSLYQNNGSRRAAQIDNDAIGIMKQTDTYTIMGSEQLGFVVISNDQAQRPVLAYSDQQLNVQDIPCGMQWWLNAVSEVLARHDAASAALSRSSRRAGNTRVEPFLKSKWNQSDPFNLKCPAINNSKTPTGCVATALAQVLYFYQYPAQSKGTGYYTVGSSSNQTYVELNTTYDWTLFQDTYFSSFFLSAAKKEAISQLMADCGAAVHMHYNSSGSGAVLSRAGTALGANFQCDSLAVQALQRDFYDRDEWLQLIRTELEAGRPVIYGGQDPNSGGHAFVLHGIDEDNRVYVNWGWGGNGDCWTDIDILQPENDTDSYSEGQDMVIGLKTTPIPDPAETYRSFWGMDTAEDISLSLAKTLLVSEFKAFNYSHLTFYGVLGLYFRRISDGEEVFIPYIVTGEDVDPVESGYGYTFPAHSFSTSDMAYFEPGTYQVYLASQAVQETSPRPLLHARDRAGSKVDGKVNVYTITIDADHKASIDSKEELKDVPTAIDAIEAPAEPAAIRYYDLQGREVDASHRGLTIVRQGGSVKKVVR